MRVPCQALREMKKQGPFADRRAAGRALARVLAKKNFVAPVVLALPRGGVPVAAEIAVALGAPLDIVLVRKIGVPYQPELAAAAVVDGGDPEIVTNDDVVRLAGVTPTDLAAGIKRELAEIERRRSVYLPGAGTCAACGPDCHRRGRRDCNRGKRSCRAEGCETEGPEIARSWPFRLLPSRLSMHSRRRSTRSSASGHPSHSSQ